MSKARPQSFQRRPALCLDPGLSHPSNPTTPGLGPPRRPKCLACPCPAPSPWPMTLPAPRVYAFSSPSSGRPSTPRSLSPLFPPPSLLQPPSASHSSPFCYPASPRPSSASPLPARLPSLPPLPPPLPPNTPPLSPPATSSCPPLPGIGPDWHPRPSWKECQYKPGK